MISNNHISKIFYKSDTNRYFLNENLLLENPNQAIKFLKEKNLDPDTSEEGKKILDDITKITRGDGFTHLMVKFHLNNKIPLDEIEEIHDYLKKNKRILNQLPKPVVKYDSYNMLRADIMDFESKRVATKLYNELPRDLKDQYDKLDERNKIYFKDLATKYYKLSQEEQSGFDLKKIRAFKDIKDFIEKLDNYITTIEQGIDYQTIKKKIEETKGAFVAYSNEETGILISHVQAFSASQTLGCTTSWCITTTASYWRNYKKGGKYYFFIWDYNKPVTDDLFLVGTAYNPQNPEKSSTYSKTNNSVGLLTVLSDKSISNSLLDNYIENFKENIKKNIGLTPIIDLIKNGPEEELIENIENSSFYETHGGEGNVEIYNNIIELHLDEKEILNFYEFDENDLINLRYHRDRYGHDSVYIDDDEFNYIHSYINDDNVKLLIELSKKLGSYKRYDFAEEGNIYDFSRDFNLDIEDVFRDELSLAKEEEITKEVEQIYSEFLMDPDNGDIDIDKLFNYIGENNHNPQTFDDIMEIIKESTPYISDINEIEYNVDPDLDNLNNAIRDRIEYIEDNIEDFVDIENIDYTYDYAYKILEKLGYKYPQGDDKLRKSTPEKNIFINEMKYIDDVLHFHITIIYREGDPVPKSVKGWVGLKRLVEITQHYTLSNIDERRMNKIVNEEVRNLFEDFNNDINTLKRFGYKLIEKEDIGKYRVFLMFEPRLKLYQIALTSNEQSFITPQSQEKVKTTTNVSDSLKTYRKLKDIILGWLNKYGSIYVGSLNKEKTNKYRSLLDKMGFGLTQTEQIPPQFNNGVKVFPESWNFKITKK